MATAKKTAKKTAAKKSSAKKSTATGFSAAERAAMKERAAELRESGRGGDKLAKEAQACLDKIAELPQPDRRLAERIHAIVADVAPQLTPKTWYGFPSYAKDGKIVVFFKPASKFGERYATLGFNDVAQLDEGTLWPNSYAVSDLTAADEKTVATLVKKAAG